MFHKKNSLKCITMNSICSVTRIHKREWNCEFCRYILNKNYGYLNTISKPQSKNVSHRVHTLTIYGLPAICCMGQFLPTKTLSSYVVLPVGTDDGDRTSPSTTPSIRPKSKDTPSLFPEINRPLPERWKKHHLNKGFQEIVLSSLSCPKNMK